MYVLKSFDKKNKTILSINTNIWYDYHFKYIMNVRRWIFGRNKLFYIDSNNNKNIQPSKVVHNSSIWDIKSGLGVT